MIILYLDKCQCRYEKKIAMIKTFLNEHDEELHIRKTQYDAGAKTTADMHQFRMPFIYNDRTNAGMILEFVDTSTINGII